MRVVVRNDADQIEAVMEDVDKDDVDQLRSEMPSGWWIDKDAQVHRADMNCRWCAEEGIQDGRWVEQHKFLDR
jgi:hypothetical protein